MDETLKIVVAAAVLLMVAVVLFFLVSDQTDVFSGTTNDEVTKAECELGKTQYRRVCDCSATPSTTQEARNIKTEYQNKGCEWAKAGAPTFSCSADVCS